MQNAAEKPPIFLPSWTAMYVINSFVVVWVLVIGFGFGGWASVTNFVKQVDTFGLFAKCYQCKPPTPPVAAAPHHWSWVWTTWPNLFLSHSRFIFCIIHGEVVIFPQHVMCAGFRFFIFIFLKIFYFSFLLKLVDKIVCLWWFLCYQSIGLFKSDIYV